MKNWKIIGAITLVVLAIAAWRIISYERERNRPAVTVNKPTERPMSAVTQPGPKALPPEGNA